MRPCTQPFPSPPSAIGATSWQHRPQFCSVGNLTRGMTCATCPLDRQSGLCLPLRCARFLRVAHQDYRQGILTLVVSTAAIAANRLCAGAGIRLAFVSSRGSSELARLEKIIHVCFYICIQSVGQLKDLSIPAPTQVLWEAFYNF